MYRTTGLLTGGWVLAAVAVTRVCWDLGRMEAVAGTHKDTTRLRMPEDH